MKKTIALGLVVAALAGAGQASALTNTVEGFFRVQAGTHNLAKGNDLDPDQLVTQRFRLKYTMGVNDYVKVVYFGEIDMEWGDASFNSYAFNSNGTIERTTRNNGGSIGGDQVNLETKNLYAEVKAPNFPLVATIGLQGTMDSYDMALLGPSDVAGLSLRIPTSMISAELAWFKLIEGNRFDSTKSKTTTIATSTVQTGDNGNNDAMGSARAEDDVDVYFARVSAKPLAGLKVGGDLYYFKGQGSSNGSWLLAPDWTAGYTGLPANQTFTVNRQDLYYLGLNAGYSTPLFGINGWFLYNWGKLKGDVRTTAADPSTPSGKTTIAKSSEDVKISGYGASLKGEVNIAGANAFLRGVYFSKANDDPEKIESVWTPLVNSTEIGPFATDGILQLMVADVNNLNGGLTGWVPLTQDVMYHGYGLTGFVLGGTYVPPAMNAFYAKGAVAYFRALDTWGFYGEREGKTVGTELAGRVGYKFLGGAFDLSLNGAYAWLGNFWNNTDSQTTGAYTVVAGEKQSNPDNLYRVYLQANIPF